MSERGRNLQTRTLKKPRARNSYDTEVVAKAY